MGDNDDIKIGNVHGNVTVSKNQNGGVTAHYIKIESSHKNKKIALVVTLIGIIGTIVTFLTYFGINPF